MPRRPDFAWTETTIGYLKQRHAAGVSYGTIARELRITRNAAIGKAQRLGMSSPRPAGPHDGVKIKKARQAKVKPAKTPVNSPVNSPIRPPVIHPPLLLPLLELASTSCRWPLPAGFCAVAAISHSPYCAVHHRMAHRPAPVQRAPRWRW